MILKNSCFILYYSLGGSLLTLRYVKELLKSSNLASYQEKEHRCDVPVVSEKVRLNWTVSFWIQREHLRRCQVINCAVVWGSWAEKYVRVVQHLYAQYLHLIMSSFSTSDAFISGHIRPFKTVGGENVTNQYKNLTFVLLYH